MWIERKWGQYFVMEDWRTIKVKKLLIDSGGKISYQKHNERSEDWYIVRGVGVAKIEGQLFYVGPGSHVSVPVGTWHDIQNLSSETMVIIEVQRGTKCDEDDIIRETT